MPDTNNNPDIFGSTTDLNAGSAIGQVQREEIRRMEAAKQQAEAANPTPQSEPMSASDLMAQAAQEAQARTNAAEARAAGFETQAAAPVSPALPPASSPRRSAFDAAEANARAASASKGFPVAQDAGRITFSAPKDAPDAFDWDAYNQARQTGYWPEPTPQPLVPAASETPLADTPANDPRVAPSPSYARTEAAEDLWANLGNGRVDAAFASRVPEYQQEIESQRTARAASVAGVALGGGNTWADARAAWSQWRNEPLADKFDSFADTAARFGVDTGVLGERVRGVGMAAMSRVQHEWNSPFGPMQAGFALEAVGKSAGEYYEQTNSGRYLTPEQQGAAQAGMLPSILGAVGTVVGAATPLGAWGGSLIGSGVGAAAQGVIGANDERSQVTRETAERLSAALGQAADSVGAFKAQIEATGVSTVQFSQALSAAGSVGTYGPNSVAGIGALTNSFQERAGTDFGVLAKYTSNPLLFGMGNRLSSGGLGASDIVSLGYDAAETGDFDGLKTLQQAARDASTKNDPAYQAAAGRLNTDSQSLFGLGAIGVAGTRWLRGHGYHPNSDINADLQTEDDRKTADVGTTGAAAMAQNALINQFASLKSQDIVAQSGIKYAEAGIGLVVAQGGSAAQIGQASQSLYSGLSAARSSTQSEISQLQADLADPQRSVGRTGELRARIADAQAKLGGYDVAEAQQRRSVFQNALGEEQAGFGLDAERYTLSGRSAASLSPGYARQEAYLMGVAEDPRNPLSPSERAGIEDGALRMRYGQAQSVYGEENAALAVTRAGREAEVSRAALLGTPQDQYVAAINSLTSDRQQIAQNQSELTRGDLTYGQRLGLQAQDVALNADLVVGAERARVDAYNAEGSILGNDQAAGRSLLDRNAQVYGAKAFTPDIFAADQANINLWTGAENGSPMGSAQRSQFGRDRADAEMQITRDRDSSYQFGNQAQRVGDMQAEGAFDRALKAPYRTGDSESDPLFRGAALEQVYQRDLVGAQAALARTPQSSPAYEYNARMVEDYKSKLQGIQHDRMWEEDRRLPEMLAGGGGMTGNSMMVVPQAALSAFFSPNVRDGSWGHPVTTPGLSRPGSMPGNSFDAFQAHASQAHASQAYVSQAHASALGAGAPSLSSPAALTTAIRDLAHGMNTQQLAVLLQQMLAELRTLAQNTKPGLAAQGGPLRSSSGAINQANRQGFDSNRPSLR